MRQLKTCFGRCSNLARELDLIVARPTDNALLAAMLQAANYADTSVAAYDHCICGATLTSHISPDNFTAG